MDQSFGVISSEISYCHAFRLLPNLLTSGRNVMLKFLERKECIGLECLLPVLDNKTATKSQMIGDFSKSLYLVLIYVYLNFPHASWKLEKILFSIFFREPSSQHGLPESIPGSALWIWSRMNQSTLLCSCPWRYTGTLTSRGALRDPLTPLLPGCFTPLRTTSPFYPITPQFPHAYSSPNHLNLSFLPPLADGSSDGSRTTPAGYCLGSPSCHCLWAPLWVCRWAFIMSSNNITF